ncbi:MpaA2 family daptide-type RiPP [Microbacterium lacticum]|nr:MpaA2 family daptide-type RiPP [Microbacterium lacticum]
MNNTLVMDNSAHRLEFTELDAMDAPDNAVDWMRGVTVGMLIGLIALT